MEALRNFKFVDLYDKLKWTEDEFVEWFQHLKLIHSKRSCPGKGDARCGEPMKLRQARGGRTYPQWQCPKKNCRKEVGFLVGTFFEGGHFSLKEVRLKLIKRYHLINCQVFQFSYFWAWNKCDWVTMEHEFQRDDETTLSKETWVDYRNYFREVAEQYFVRLPAGHEQIGGPGRHVQIDETFISKRKYNRGSFQKKSIKVNNIFGKF
jgi:hypothetical protein